MSPQPFWFADALAQEGSAALPPLQGEHTADVCIVGGGFTGLWTAIQTRLKRPDWRIVLLEKGRCGGGASGRNGGCMLTWSTKYASLCHYFGEQEAAWLLRASEQAVFDIATFCQQHGIDADLRLGGAVYAASNRAQQGRLQPVLQQLEQAGLNRWQALDDAATQARSGSALMRDGAWTDAAGSVHPGKLVRGLLRVARALGVEVHELSPVQAVGGSLPVRVSTDQGILHAPRVVLALNAETPALLPQFASHLLLVSSDMIITEPAPAQIAALGLDQGQAVCDLRTFVHYWRSTPDGRLMLGKGGNLLPFGNRLHPAFDAPSRYQPMLHHALRRFFPSLASVPLARSWTGASERSASGLPCFGELPRQRGVYYGFGYSGNGVVQSHLGGQILSSLLLDEDNIWTRSGLAQGPQASFPPEPVRWLGAQLVRGAIRRVETAEDRAQPSRWLDRKLARLASMAGKADARS
ncbi:FAD-dependent oxidoreductase [Leeia sp.]|uniref:FAD-dependent oxidoreductase n=1 Tax=Leeia sp. TaxID=2884678 RepID=UPI0035B3EB7A